MSVVAQMKTASGDVDAGPIATTGEWSEFQTAVLAFTNISELVKLTQQGKADDGFALREDLEAIFFTFELSEASTLIAKELLKIAVRMNPGDVLIVTE